MHEDSRVVDVTEDTSLMSSSASASMLGVHGVRDAKGTNSMSFAVIARVWVGEIPYLKSFMSHYQGIGVDHIVLVITRKWNAEEIHHHLEECGYLRKHSQS